MLGLFLLLFYGLVIAVALSTVAIVRRLRNPSRRTYASAVARKSAGDPGELPPPAGPREFRAFTFQASRGPGPALHLPAWEIPGDRPSGPIIICTPGWGDSKVGVLPRLGAFLPHASHVIAWDPAGLGESPAGSQCNLGTEADVEALCELARTCVSPHAPSPKPQALILFGWSLGAGVSLVAATRLAREGMTPLGVIAEAPYREAKTPVVNFLESVRLPYRAAAPFAMAWLGLHLRGTMNWKSFDRARFAPDLPCPLLVLHGTLDAICPITDGRQIAAAARRSLFVSIEGAGHNDLWTDERHRPQCERAVADFVHAVTSEAG
jgi:pimeloyl-ACP methyl ester carboxylesterase